MIRMPGTPHTGPLRPITAAQGALARTVKRDVTELAGNIGIRNAVSHSELEKSADYMEKRLRETGLPVARQTYTFANRPFHNLEYEIAGASPAHDTVVVGGPAPPA